MRLHAISGVGWRAALLALVLAGSFSATASATVRDMVIDDTAQLSPGMLHATLTGSVTCDPGDFSSFGGLSGQIVQSKGGSGYGYVQPTCDGAPHPFSIDVSSTGFGSGAFKPGKANAQITATTCDPYTWMCTTTYKDAIIRLMK